MKKNYNQPNVEVLNFVPATVLASSPGNINMGGGNGGGGVDPD